MGVPVEMIYPARIEGRGPSDHTVDFVALFEEQLGQIRAILSRHTGDEGLFHLDR